MYSYSIALALCALGVSAHLPIPVDPAACVNGTTPGVPVYPPGVTPPGVTPPGVTPPGGYTPPSGVTPPGNNTCTAGATFNAVLFDGQSYSGIKHWVDGLSGDCRGLNGTEIQSIRIVASAGGDPVRNRVSSGYAAGVTLEFFNDFSCLPSSSIGKRDGNAASVSFPNSRSVRITCNGRGNGTGVAVPVTDTATIQLFEGCDFKGISHQQDGFIGECRGLSGVAVSSMQFLLAPNSTVVLDQSKATQYAATFFDDFGCNGKALATVVGNAADTCKAGLCQTGKFPKSVMLVYSDPAQRANALAGASSVVATSALTAFVAVVASMFF